MRVASRRRGIGLSRNHAQTAALFTRIVWVRLMLSIKGNL